MTHRHSTPSDLLRDLRERALELPGASADVACEGTSLERRTVTVRKRAFVFFGDADLRLKLGASLAEASALVATSPASVKAGKSGWVTVTFDGDGAPPRAVLERWLDESYALFAATKRS